MNKRTTTIAGLILLSMAAATVRAELATFNFHGVITEHSFSNIHEFDVGDPFSGYVTLDLAATPFTDQYAIDYFGAPADLPLLPILDARMSIEPEVGMSFNGPSGGSAAIAFGAGGQAELRWFFSGLLYDQGIGTDSSWTINGDTFDAGGSFSAGEEPYYEMGSGRITGMRVSVPESGSTIWLTLGAVACLAVLRRKQ